LKTKNFDYILFLWNELTTLTQVLSKETFWTKDILGKVHKEIVTTYEDACKVLDEAMESGNLITETNMRVLTDCYLTLKKSQVFENALVFAKLNVIKADSLIEKLHSTCKHYLSLFDHREYLLSSKFSIAWDNITYLCKEKEFHFENEYSHAIIEVKKKFEAILKDTPKLIAPEVFKVVGLEGNPFVEFAERISSLRNFLDDFDRKEEQVEWARHDMMESLGTCIKYLYTFVREMLQRVESVVSMKPMTSEAKEELIVLDRTYDLFQIACSHFEKFSKLQDITGAITNLKGDTRSY
jgi:hypothetical protein